MQDDEIIGGALKLMHDDRYNSMTDFGKIFASLGVTDENVIRGIQSRMKQKGLIDVKAQPVGNPGGYGAITDYGIEVFEGKVPKPMPMIFNSVTISGSSNVQLGQGNTQNVSSIDVGKLNAAIDGATATMEEKAEAKSLLAKLVSNPLLKGLWEKWLGGGLG